jgi:hypothetical protein
VTYDGWIGATVVDVDGTPIGEIAQIYVDDRTRRPEWLAVAIDASGEETTLVPVVGSTTVEGDGIQVPLPKDVVVDAPRVDPGAPTNHLQEEALWSHYGYDHARTSEADGFGYGAAYSRDRADAGFPSVWDDSWLPRRERLRRYGR